MLSETLVIQQHVWIRFFIVTGNKNRKQKIVSSFYQNFIAIHGIDSRHTAGALQPATTFNWLASFYAFAAYSPVYSDATQLDVELSTRSQREPLPQYCLLIVSPQETG